jgi:hypothetical protein
LESGKSKAGEWTAGESLSDESMAKEWPVGFIACRVSFINAQKPMKPAEKSGSALFQFFLFWRR